MDPKALPLKADQVHECADKLMNWSAGVLSDNPSKAFRPRLVAYVKNHSDSPEFVEVTFDLSGQWGTHDEKNKGLYAIGEGLYRNKALVAGVALSCEAWYVFRTDDTLPVRPSEEPDKEECISIMAGSTGGRFNTVRHLPVSRDAAGCLIPGDPKTDARREYRHLDLPLLAWFWKGYFATALSKLEPAPEKTSEKVPSAG